jgi:hypothetical protein
MNQGDLLRINIYREHSLFKDISMKKGIVNGLVLALLTLSVFFFGFETRLFLYQMILIIIPAVYIGFALQEGISGNVKLIETIQLLFYVILVFLSRNISAYFIPLGFFLHGIWDLLHKSERLRVSQPPWYIPACIVYDWIFAAISAFDILFRTGGLQ